MVPRISRWGNSLAVRIPKALLDSAGLAEGDPLLITARAHGLVLERAEHIDLGALIDGITDENRPDASFDVAPVGRELL